MKLSGSTRTFWNTFAGKAFVIALSVLFSVVVFASAGHSPQSPSAMSQNDLAQPFASNYYSGYSFNPSKAVTYAMMVHTDYLHAKKYPAGLNGSAPQENLDYYNSEDCAHYVSEALIAGGLTSLATNPPGDNLTNYQSGFPGSYGIVGVYRLADYLAGYDLPVFPTNATQERVMGYQPIPASYNGSPHASIYYVTNDSILPQYVISPGDVIADGGVGSGHAMLYIGNGKVVQTDPAQIWTYYPGTDYNISFYGMLTLHGANVSAIYIHMPTISSSKSVRITGLEGSRILNQSSESVKGPAKISMIASYPDGVGFGNYSYSWYINGTKVSSSQQMNLNLFTGKYSVELAATGSNGTAYDNMTLNVQGSGFSILGLGTAPSIGVVAVPIVAAGAGVSIFFMRKRSA